MPDNLHSQSTPNRPSESPAPPDPYSALFHGEQGLQRVARVRRALERALNAWWHQGEIPARGLLRDGLLVLEAGHDLDEPMRTLLLRAALYHGKGMLTAIKHQTDPERTASVMRDMLLDPRRPLNPAQIHDLRQRDETGARWFDPLLRMLGEEANQPLEPRRTLADAARLYLQDPPAAMGAWIPLAKQDAVARAQQAKKRRTRARRRRTVSTVLGILAFLLLILSGASFWQYNLYSQNRNNSVRIIPGGMYLISDPDAGSEDAGDRLVQVKTFAIDRTEVTNRAYRRCMEAGVCPRPERTSSVKRPDYFLNYAYDGYPMVNVTWTQAESYCQWIDKRLPLEEEWAIAAGSALTLQERFRFPWGNVYDTALVNGGLSPIQDTVPVGTYSPAGDSPAGVADVAGNVAEWTATPADEAGNAYVVKGGSFLSPPEELTVDSRQVVAKDAHHPWLGFRCAETLTAD